jgi:hypothetical protein
MEADGRSWVRLMGLPSGLFLQSHTGSSEATATPILWARASSIMFSRLP